MGRREDFNRHHSIRHTYDTPPKRRIPLLIMLMLIVTCSFVVTALKSTEPSPALSPQREKLLGAASLVAEGAWGNELVDSCLIMLDDFTQAGDTEAAAYLTLLVEGSQPDASSDKLTAALTSDKKQ
ncbi:MAG: hypothetical protein RRY54_07650, partial [Angelakisella sp.]